MSRFYFSELQLYYHTVKHLKFRQVYYYIFYWIKRKWLRKVLVDASKDVSGTPFVILPRPVIKGIDISEDNSFSFLNEVVAFGSVYEINWNHDANGKLWAYNLNYFEFLHLKKLSVSYRLALLHDYYSKRKLLTHGVEPYCISLRNVNIIFFMVENHIKEPKFDSLLWTHYKLLQNNLEYHLGANHLLENACSLVIGGIYFEDQSLYTRGSVLLQNELNEQFFQDGGHYERSPMYHAILLVKLLDVLNVLIHNSRFEDQEKLVCEIRNVTARMLGWIIQMSVNGIIPAFHDSTNIQKFKIVDILQYSERLHVLSKMVSLQDSNYRRYDVDYFCIIVDVGSAFPSYQPGHYHAGIFSFVLFSGHKPLIVDPGVSTYKNNTRRHLERSTSMHNTVVVNGVNQSEVWSSFRVARRANVNIDSESKDGLSAFHTGYRRLSKIHYFSLLVENDFICLEHKLLPDQGKSQTENVLSLHLHPDVVISELDGDLILDNLCCVKIFDGDYFLETYQYAEDFNILKTGKVVRIKIQDICKIAFHKIS